MVLFWELLVKDGLLKESEGLAGVGAVVGGGLGSVGAVIEDVVLGDQLEGRHDVLLGLVGDDGGSGEDPDVLLGEEGTEADAAVDDGVVLVVGADDLVVASGDVRNELDLEVALVLGGVHNEGVAETTAPDLLVVVPLVVENADGAVVVQGVGGGVADAVLVGGVLVTDDFVPLTEESVKVEVLDNLGVLAAAGLHGGGGGTDKADGSDKGLHLILVKFCIIAIVALSALIQSNFI